MGGEAKSSCPGQAEPWLCARVGARSQCWDGSKAVEIPGALGPILNQDLQFLRWPDNLSVHFPSGRILGA